MLSFDEFCDYVKDNIRAYMSEAFQKNNYEFRLDEKKDDFDMVNALLRIEDKQKPDAIVPIFHLDAAYENYKQTGNVESIVVMLASKYEATYQEKLATGEKLRPEFEVLSGEGGISNAFIISNMGDKHINLYQDDTLIEISTKECSNLLLVAINEDVLLAVPVKNRKDYQECVECLEVIKKESPEQSVMELQPRLYDRDNNVVLKTAQDIDAMLQRMDKEQIGKKRSVFSRG